MIVIMIIREIISQTYRKQLESNQFNFSVAYGLANRAIPVLACFRIQDTSGGLEPPNYVFAVHYIILLGLLYVSL